MSLPAWLFSFFSREFAIGRPVNWSVSGFQAFFFAVRVHYYCWAGMEDNSDDGRFVLVSLFHSRLDLERNGRGGGIRWAVVVYVVV